MPRRDLSLVEQDRVVGYLKVLRQKFRNWQTVERATGISHSQRVLVTTGQQEVTAAMAFRIAKLMNVSLYDVLAGTALPPNVCPHCGHEIVEPTAAPSPAVAAARAAR